MSVRTQPRGRPPTPVRTTEGTEARRPLLSSWPILASILTLAAALRFGALGSNSLWFDEALTAHLAQLQWHALTTSLVARDVHPPLYFYLVKVWIGLSGIGEAALRFPSAVASIFSVLLTYLIMRRMAPGPVSLLGAMLVGLSPFDVIAAQEARMYALLEMLTLACTLAVILSVERGGVLRWTAYAAAATAMIYTHYLGILIITAHGLWIMWLQRAQLRKWLLAAAGTVLFCGVWIPSFWHQFTMVELHRTWFRHPVASSDLTGLLGLFAFGGSLLGMPGFFTAGSLDPVVQWIVLLPFLFLLWQGATAPSSDRSRVALLGFTLAFPIGAMFLISFAKPMFYARWFSFLLPLYAMFIALGIVETARRIPARRTILLASVSGGVLLCSVPVFGRYYFDPGSRPYQWRDAAALVRAQAHPQDFILYVHDASQIAFGYYFHDPHPSLVLNPTEAFAGTMARPAFTAPQAHELAVRYRRVWLIIMPPFNEQMGRRLFPALRNAFQFGNVNDFRGVRVVRLDTKL